ncbi:MAG: hypothetical protein LBL91_01870 [Lachnospiraceae bacterium]|jgi:hypothetical protein|nr:hypothetical protein [Lachnospiraceae bacterium]
MNFKLWNKIKRIIEKNTSKKQKPAETKLIHRLKSTDSASAIGHLLAKYAPEMIAELERGNEVRIIAHRGKDHSAKSCSLNGYFELISKVS